MIDFSRYVRYYCDTSSDTVCCHCISVIIIATLWTIQPKDWDLYHRHHTPNGMCALHSIRHDIYYIAVVNSIIIAYGCFFSPYSLLLNVWLQEMLHSCCSARNFDVRKLHDGNKTEAKIDVQTIYNRKLIRIKFYMAITGLIKKLEKSICSLYLVANKLLSY